METRGPVPGATVAPEELAALLRQPGPFATVYLCTEAAIDNAAQRSEGRWKPLRSALLDKGAPEDVVAAVDPLIGDAHLRGDGLAVVVPAAGEPHVEHLPKPPARDAASFGPVPSLAPLLDSRQRRIPHVLAVVDRHGADLTAVRREGPDVQVEVEGEDHPIHKAKAGGWSQRRFQQRVEATWEENAEEAADALARLAEMVEARLVLVGGDTRAVQLLRDSLPDPVRALVKEVEGSRAADGSEPLDEAEVSRMLATAVAEEAQALLHKHREERGQQDRACDGLEATVAALSEARAAALLVAEELPGATLWFGTEPVPVASSSAAASDLGADDPQDGPAVDVLVRAALGTGAGIRVVPANAIPDGVGAILRW